MTLLDYAALNEQMDRDLPGRSFVNQCEAFRFYATRATNGLAKEQMQSNASAKVARGRSTIIDKNREAATPGQVGFWAKTSFEHDMLSLGNDIWIGATGLGDTIVDLGGGVKILHGSTYPAPFLGRADKVGSNPKALLLPYPIAPVVHAPGAAGAWAFNPPSAAIQKRIQVAMAKRGRYTGKLNGIWGPLSIKGIQLTARNVGYTGPINGVPGFNTCHFIQVYAKTFGKYTGPVNSILGPNTWLGFARGLEAGLR